jgi:exo-beta-1,3-glucanase (GH17 family)
MGTTDTSLYPSASSPGTPFSYAYGFNYSRFADISKVKAPKAKSDLTQISEIAKMIRIFDWNEHVMAEALKLDMEVALGTTNDSIVKFATPNPTDKSKPSTYVADFIAKITPYSSIIKIITIGNEVFENNAKVSDVVAAIQNLHKAMGKLDIQVTTDVIWAQIGVGQEPDYKPSSGTLTTNGTTLLAALKALYGDHACLFASLYPFLDLKGWVDNHGLGQAFAQKHLPYVTFQNPALGPCANQFDSDYTTLRTAMKADYSEVTVIVSETGYPTEYYSPYTDAPNPEDYFEGYQSWQKTNKLGLTTFWFEMYDEPEKGKDTFNARWGIYDEDGAVETGMTIPDWTTKR